MTLILRSSPLLCFTRDDCFTILVDFSQRGLKLLITCSEPGEEVTQTAHGNFFLQSPASVIYIKRS